MDSTSNSMSQDDPYLSNGENIEQNDNSKKENSSELVSDTDSEEYEERQTGVKINYKLKNKEVFDVLRRNGDYNKQHKSILKYTILQSFFIILLLIFYVEFSDIRFIYLISIPLFSILSMFGIMYHRLYLEVKRKYKKFTAQKIFSVEIFPDVIEVLHGGVNTAIPLDETSKSEVLGKMIIVYPKDKDALLIPMRAIEPNLLPDVHSMIFAGTKPKFLD